MVQLFFKDGERSFRITTAIKEEDICLIHSTCAPVHDHLFEFLLMVETLQREDAKTITAFMPYVGYGRQINDLAGTVARHLINNSGIDELITLDSHSLGTLTSFSVPTHNISMSNVFIPDIRARFSSHDCVIVSLDTGGVSRAQTYALALNIPLTVLYKKRNTNGSLHAASHEGEIRSKTCLIIDDMIDSGETLRHGVAHLHARGVHDIHAYITHAVFSQGSGVLDQVSHLSSLTLSNFLPGCVFHPKTR